MRWILLVLFVVDWWLVGLELAVLVTLRLVLLAGVFALLFCDHHHRRVPPGPGVAAPALPLRLQPEPGLSEPGPAGRRVAGDPRGAARCAGCLPELRGLARRCCARAGDLVALTVPAVVLTTRRAWAITEAAYARGFDSPAPPALSRLNACTPAGLAG